MALSMLATEAERTQRVITGLIGLLLVVAALLALLTVWYWRHTDPRRRVFHVDPRHDALDEQFFELDPASGGTSPAGSAQPMVETPPGMQRRR